MADVLSQGFDPNYTFSQPANQSATIAPKQSSGLGGFLQRAGKSLIQAPKYFVNTDIINPAKELAASFTGNQVAAANAQKQSNVNLGLGASGTNFTGGLKTLVGNTGQLASMVVAPEAKGLGLGAKVAQGAKVGALSGGSSALANNQGIIKGALEGAVTGGAANGILSKVLGGKGAIAGAQDAQVAAAKRAAGFKQPVASGGAQLQKYGTDLLANKLNISPADAIKFNGPETIARLQKEHGLTVNQAAQLHPVVTGGEGATTLAMDNALHGMPNVNFGNFKGTLLSRFNDPEFQAANLPDGVSSAQSKNLQAVIDKYHTALNPASETPITKEGIPQAPGLDAQSGMGIARNLEKQGYNNQASTSANKQALGELQLRMADHIKDTIFNAPGGQTALEGAKADAIQNLSDLAKQSGNTKLNSVAHAISDAKTFPEFRNVSQPFVNAKQLVDKSNINDFANAGQNTGKGGLFSTAKSAVSKVASPVGGKVLSNVGNKIAANEPKASTGFLNNLTVKNPQLAAGITRAGTVGSASAIANPPKSQQTSATPTSAAVDMINSIPSGSSSTANTPSTPFSAENIQAAILQDIAANGGKNISSLVSLYNTFGKPATTQSTAEKNMTDNLNSALATLNTYNDQLQTSGGGRGVAGGTVQNVLGKFGLGGSSATNVRAIESQKTDVATSIAKALTGGKPSSAQIKSWEDAIPNVTDSPAVAKQKMANITASINAKLQTFK